jgi:arsenate reductase (thioredoxin)
MSNKVYRVLFVCTHNSARSIMAEALMNQLGRPLFMAYSAGSHPAQALSARALEALANLRVPTDGLRPKDWREFARHGAPQLDFVITVCNKAAGEVCPVWPNQPTTALWGVADPSAVEGSQVQKARAFEDTALVLKRRIELMLALPLASLDRLAIQRELKAIGTL